MADRVELCKNWQFHVHIFTCRLDHQVTVRHGFNISGGLDPCQRLGTGLLGDFIFLYQPFHAGTQSIQAFLRHLVRDILHDDVIAPDRAGLGNTITHSAGTNHTDILKTHVC